MEELVKLAIDKKIPEDWLRVFNVTQARGTPTLKDRLAALRNAGSHYSDTTPRVDGEAGPDENRIGEDNTGGGILKPSHTTGLTRHLLQTALPHNIPYKITRYRLPNIDPTHTYNHTEWSERPIGTNTGVDRAEDDYILFTTAAAGDGIQLLHFASMLGTEVHSHVAYTLAVDAGRDVASGMSLLDAHDSIYTRERIRPAHKMSADIKNVLDNHFDRNVTLAVELPVWIPFAMTASRRTIETRIDAVLRHQDGRHIIVELKTIPGIDTQHTHPIPSNRDVRQVILNAFAYNVCYGKGPEMCAIVYCNRSGGVDVCEFSYNPGSDIVRQCVAELFLESSKVVLYCDANLYANSRGVADVVRAGRPVAPLAILRYLGHRTVDAIRLRQTRAIRAPDWRGFYPGWSTSALALNCKPVPGVTQLRVYVSHSVLRRRPWTRIYHGPLQEAAVGGPVQPAGSIFQPGVTAEQAAGRRLYPSTETDAHRRARKRVNSRVKAYARVVADTARIHGQTSADLGAPESTLEVAAIRAVHREANTIVAAKHPDAPAQFPHNSQRALQRTSVLLKTPVVAAATSLIEKVS